ncbi:CP family cyanate transporter-like MFS transporter [Neisseria sp. HSC-16F19]|nr:MFS transporter [Neisseria sp. HSC-16F19]MCP2040069.1 CP family cyanate transporter-like MFS transporter [Neisseria sp. HSC-16F19]
MTRKQQTGVLLALAVLLLAANQRAPIVAVGPLAPLIQADLQLGSTLMGWVTSLPVLCFALFAPAAPWLARRFGVQKVLAGAAALLLAGIVLRTAYAHAAVLLAGTLVLSLGITLANILQPSVVKRYFPLRVGLMTALFSAVMSLVAGTASAVSVPLAERYDWAAALWLWAFPALLALLVWLWVLRGSEAAAPAPATAAVDLPLWRLPLAWSISVFMGSQSLVYYMMAAWLPAMVVSKGVPLVEAGWYGLVFQWVSIPVSFAVGMLAERMRKQTVLAVGASLCGITGVLGLWFLPTGWATLCVVLMGASTAGAFALSLMFFSLRTDTPAEAGRLSAMAQTVGYLLAAVGPAGAGWLLDASGSWLWPLGLLAGVLLIQCACGWHSAQPHTLRQSAARRRS